MFRSQRQPISVSAQLHIMSAMIVLSGILGVIGAIQITKGAEMHKLNFLHVKYNDAFRSQIDAFVGNDAGNTLLLRQQLLLVREQPVKCLAFIGRLDRIIMTILGTGDAITVCHQDLNLANQTLSQLDEYDWGRVTKADLLEHLTEASQQFQRYSEQFEPLVETTISKVSRFVVSMVVLNAVLLAVCGVLLSRSVARDYRRLESTERVLEQDIQKRKEAEADRDRLNLELRETTRRAGMAELATGVLHNVGNVLNSLNVSTTLICQRMTTSPVGSLSKAVNVVLEQKGRFGHFFEHDERGKRFPELLSALATSLENERNSLLAEFRELMKSVDHIKAIVVAQQTLAKRTASCEPIDPAELVDDAIRMNDVNLMESNVAIIRECEPLGEVNLQQHNVLQILVNLIRNSQQAFDQSSVTQREITLSVTRDSDFVCFAVRDNGVGIEAKNLNSIFQHGFTTKKTGHGFGLHACANSAQEMGGSLTVTSDGKHKGCCFTLRLPIFELSANATQQDPTLPVTYGPAVAAPRSTAQFR